MKNTKLYLLSLFVLTVLFSFPNLSNEKEYDKILLLLKPPPPGKLGIADLWRAQITNSTKETFRIYFYGTLSEKKAGMIANATTVAIDIKPGITNLKASDFPTEPDVSYFGDPKYKDALIRTGNVPEGEYRYCVYAKLKSTNEEMGSDCLDQTIEGSEILSLISPSNEEEIDPKIPVTFSWMYSKPSPGAKYTLKIAEVKGEQSPEDALRINPAFFINENINKTIFNYPSSASKFLPGKKYVWQVTQGTIKSDLYILFVTNSLTTGFYLTPIGNCCYQMHVYKEQGSFFSSFKFTSNNIVSAAAETGYDVINNHIPTDFVLKTNMSPFPNGNSFVGTVCFGTSPNTIPINIEWSTDGGSTWTNRLDTTIACTPVTPQGGDIGQCQECGPCFSRGEPLIRNGNFDSLFTGFTSDFRFNPLDPLDNDDQGMTSAGQYSVKNSTNLVNTAWACTDHTTGLPGGNFFICDNSTAGGIALIQTVNVTAGRRYVFCAWVNNLIIPGTNFGNPIYDPIINVTINGIPIIAPLDLPITPDSWTAISGTWVANTTGPVAINIFSTQRQATGDDFAVDDISFAECIPLSLNAGPDITVNINQSVTLNGTGGTMCQWSPSTYLSNANICNPVFTAPGTQGTYFYVLHATGGSTECDVTLKITVIDSSSSNSCQCNGNWNDSVKAVYINPQGNKEHLNNVTCGFSIQSVHGGSEILFLAKPYICNPSKCKTEYFYKVNEHPSETPVTPLTSNANERFIVNVPTIFGTYCFTAFVKCGGVVCDSCMFTFTVPDTSHVDCQCNGNWNDSVKAVYINPQGNKEHLNNVTCGFSIQSVHGGSEILFLAKPYICNPSKCKTEYFYKVNEHPSETPVTPLTSNANERFIVNVPTIFGTYCFTAFVKCGGVVCDSCMFTFTVPDTSHVDCQCRGDWNSKYKVTYTNNLGIQSSESDDCNNFHTQMIPILQNTTVYFSTTQYTCSPSNKGCIEYKWIVHKNGHSAVELSGTSTTPVMDFQTNLLPSNLKYTFVIYAYCGGVKCDSCGFNFIVSKSVQVNCNCGNWLSSKEINIGPKTYSCGSSMSLNTNATINVTFPEYQCSPASCDTDYIWRLKGELGSTFDTTGTGIMMTYHFITPGTYTLSEKVSCGNNVCDSCILTIIVSNPHIPPEGNGSKSNFFFDNLFHSNNFNGISYNQNDFPVFMSLSDSLRKITKTIFKLKKAKSAKINPDRF